MSNWKEYTLSELCEAIVDCEHKTAPLVNNSEFYSIRTTDIKNGKILFQDANRVSFETYQEWTRRLLPIENDIILAREAPVGEVGIIPKDLKVCLGQRTVLIRPKKEFLNPHYLLYLLASPNIKADLISQSAGSVVEHLNMKNIRELILPTLPLLSEQTSIAETLSSLDNKIDLLHRQNKTLEELADCIYRNWFIEEPAIADNNEGILSNLVSHIKINVVPAKSPNKTYNHYSLPAFDDGKEPKAELGIDILSNKYKVVSNSLLISKLNPITPRIWPLYGLIDEEISICSTEFQVIKPIDLEYFGYIYCFLKSSPITQELSNAVGGTSGSHQRVSPDVILNLSISIPPKEKIMEFDEATKGFWLKIKQNKLQIQTLQKLRDTLLPKLMSGEVRVKI